MAFLFHIYIKIIMIQFCYVNFKKKNIPIYILDGRESFKKVLKKEKIKVKYIPVKKKLSLMKIHGYMDVYMNIMT